MLRVSAFSLAGGQGKTTVVLFLARLLASHGRKVLLVDADPQSSLTAFLGFSVAPDSPTLLEVLRKEVDPQDGVYPTDFDNLFLTPSDDALDDVQDFLARSGTGALTLDRRLKPLASLFDFCLIDSPPQRSQISLSVLGASDGVVIPVEATAKGIQSLGRSLELISALKDEDASLGGSILGILPFRDRWVGHNRTKDSQKNIASMQALSRDLLGDDLVLPSIRESERFKQAINSGKTLYDLGFPDLAYPFEVLADNVRELVAHV